MDAAIQAWQTWNKERKNGFPTSQSYIVAEAAILEKRLLKDLSKLTEFCHTGQLEVYQSLLLNYCPKWEHFSFNGMVARTQLAAIDHNNNSERKQAVLQSEPQQDKRCERTKTMGSQTN